MTSKQDSQVHDPIQIGFEQVLSSYLDARMRDKYGKSHPIWKSFGLIADGLRAIQGISDANATKKVKWSCGKGGWATVPWVAVLDTRETTRISEGVYIIYLFRADMTGVYLTINQGTTVLLADSGFATATKLESRTAKLRDKLQIREHAGFRLESDMDLRSTLSPISLYRPATIAHKFYERGSIPPDNQLIADLEVALRAYEHIVPSRPILGELAS